MALDVDALAATMLTAARGKLRKQWPVIAEYAAAEARKTAETLMEILISSNYYVLPTAPSTLRIKKGSCLYPPKKWNLGMAWNGKRARTRTGQQAQGRDYASRK